MSETNPYEIAPGVILLGEEVVDPLAVVTYLLKPRWRVEFTADVTRPLLVGPLSMRVTLDSELLGEGESGGINTEVLRHIPLADARVRLQNLTASGRLAKYTEFLRRRPRQPLDWAMFASVYVEAARDSKRPLAALAAASGKNRSALAQRAKRAREQGFLTSPTGDSLGELTASAKRLLGDAWLDGHIKSNTMTREGK